jgi:DNA-3-methyladenine glycosylase I
MCAYHEWGGPQRDPRILWEMLALEGFQAGLAWTLSFASERRFRVAFAGFDPRKVANFGEADVARLMTDPGIIRSQAKIAATIAGAR